jgi:hypothetical protein
MRVVAGTSTWNGIINVPQIRLNSAVTVTPDSGNNASVSSVIEVGYGDIKLTFDKAVRILIAGQAGKYLGYSRNGTFTAITNACSADMQTAGDALPAEGDCKIDIGSDLVIWTKHFTNFVTYTQSAIPASVSPGGSGGGGPGPIGVVAPGFFPTTATTTPAIPAVIPTPFGQVLGAATYNFTSDLEPGMSGNTTTELQNRLTAEGVYSGPVTGYFGSLTRAGVKAYQVKYGIPQTGTAGPLTRAQLNGSQVAGASTVNTEAVKAQIAAIQTQLASLLQQLLRLLQAQVNQYR